MVEIILNAYQELAFPMAMWALFWYIVALVVNRNDFVDAAWGFGFTYVIYWLAHEFQLTNAHALIYVPVYLWGLRLGFYLLWRNIIKSEDPRYAQWRKEWGKHLWWRSLLQIYVLQNLLLLVIALPLAYVAPIDDLKFSPWSIPGLLLWAFGMYWEVLADWQKANFKLERENKGKLMQEGLWAKSRHPNYFGEICIWWGIWAMVLPYSGAWISILSPLTITYLLLRVSGVPMLERMKKENPEYQEYSQKTPAVFPRFFSKS